MKWVGTIVREMLDLFVDSGSFAAAILVWLAFVVLVLPRLGVAAGWEGLTLFGGLALILIASATWQARR